MSSSTRTGFIVLLFICSLSSLSLTRAQPPPHGANINAASTPVPLRVQSGVPLRIIITKRIAFKQNAPVTGRLTDPVFAFDREVAPPGSEVLGKVVKLVPVDGRRRAAALLSGDFTPLRNPQIEFDTLVLKDGRRFPLKSAVTPGSGEVVRFEDAHGKKKGRIARAKAAARDRIEAEKRSVIDSVKTPGKLQRIGDILMARLPYHPQSWPAGTRLNADLLHPLDFGIANVTANALSASDEGLPNDGILHARLTTSIDSQTATVGMPVKALLSQPLFSPDHKLLYPVGSLLRGRVLEVRAARLWHRNGLLRFAFDDIQAPPNTPVLAAAPNPHPAPVAQKRLIQRFQGELAGIGVAGNQKVVMDSEGGAKATSSKTRFIAPALTMMLAGRGLDRDPVRQNGVPTGSYQSTAGGQAIGGAVGFGLIGAGLGEIAPPFSAALGFYGAAWAVYSNIIGPGHNVVFPSQTPIEVRFGVRTTPTKPISQVKARVLN